MANCKIHNVCFYNPEPRAIRCMSLQKTTNKLAISRSDASIEIWDINNTWFLEKTIPSTIENFSVEGLAWCGNKLFSVGLHGLLVQYNLYKLSIENQLVVTGESAHCLDVNKNNSLIAIGTEQGYLNVFKVREDEVMFNKFFDKQEGRIICLKFDSTGDFIVSGSIDAIRIWNVQTGHAIHKMTTGRSEKQKPTIVWCLEVTEDFTIISGDSRGKLTFWDGKLAAQIESYQSHKADILALCVSDDQSSLYCAGVDPNIINYVKITMSGNQKWIKSIQRKIHEHDVNALLVHNNKLYSGGVDGYLACSFHPPKTLLKVPPVLQSPCASMSPSARFIMLRYPKHLEVWQLGTSEHVDDNFRGPLTITEEPKKLLVLQKVAKGYDEEDHKEGILCSCMSNDGKWIFYSTHSRNRLFELSMAEHKPNLIKVKDLEHDTTPCVQATFSYDNSWLITAPNTGGLHCYELQNGRASLASKLESKDLNDTIIHVLVSPCGKYLIAGDASSNIVVWTFNKQKQQWSFYCKLPKHQFPPTTMALHPATLNLVIAYSDSKIIEYDVKKRHFSPFSANLEKLEWKTRSYPINNITFDSRVNHIIILQDDGNIMILNKEKNSIKIAAKSPKSRKIQSDLSNGSIDNKEIPKIEFTTIRKYKHLVHLSWLEEDEMIAVEVNPLSLMEQLPPAFVQNTFGRK